MNRRKFLQWLGVGAAAVAVAPSVLLSEGPVCVAPATGYATYVMGTNAMIGEYCNYANFSSFAIASAMDDVVANAAKELGEAAGCSIADLHASVFDGRL